ncbi:LysR family transcriptional regulator [Vibrio rumoiensis]|uniref:LysR family transcriptional regulator n=1 Tax=Vibrio rumoiensis 1S-45 TaxID=1188252 RepID=A0A1E5DZI5_9VIBR|nr:LysR family transcriptional regulator [Vibrio rumoiensis]OEF23404.1 LysR family transcriptional regulator [Vibrio rumoiensis 1S-45]
MRFSIEQLQAFVVSAEQGSFSAAARHLGKAQSVVSTAVSNLEADLNLSLFDRTTRSPKLTVHGEVLLVKAKRILNECGIFLSAADAYQVGIEEKITLVVESMAMTHSVAEALAQFEQAYPLVEIEILHVNEGEVLEFIRDGRAQLAIMQQLEFLYPGEIEVHGLGLLEFWCVTGMSHPLAREQQVTWQMLERHRQFIISGRYGKDAPRWRVSDQVWRTESAYSTIPLLQRGLGWASLPADLVRDLVGSQQLKRLDLAFESQPWQQGIDIIWSTQHSQGQATKTLLEELKRITL